MVAITDWLLESSKGVVTVGITVLWLRLTGHMVWTEIWGVFHAVTFLVGVTVVPGLTAAGMEAVRQSIRNNPESAQSQTDEEGEAQ